MADELTRDERIEDLAVAVDRHRANEKEFKSQLQNLGVSLAIEDARVKQQVDEVLKGLPDMSSKGLVDKILQIPGVKRTQLIDNIKKLEIAAENERRKADKTAHEKKLLENEIEQERIDGLTKHIFEQFREWARLYQIVEDFFYFDLIEAVRSGYKADSKFHMRADRLALSPTIMVSIDSHFNEVTLDHINMFNVIERVCDLGESYREHFFKKLFLRQQNVPLVREFTTKF